MVLRQCAAFYNTIGTHMIESTKPLMLGDALEFEKVREPHITIHLVYYQLPCSWHSCFREHL